MADNILDQEQAGFRKGRSTLDQIFTLSQIIEKHLEMDRQVFHIFVDFEKAFDSVNHNLLWKTLSAQNIPVKYSNLLKALYSSAECSVRIDSKTSQPFRPKRGVRQGCILSPVIFNLFLQQVINNTNLKETNIGINIQGHTINYLAFADDIDLISDNPVNCQQLTDSLWNTAKSYGLNVSLSKTENLVSSKFVRNITGINNPSGTPIKTVNTFKYLGQTIASDGYFSIEIKKRCSMALTALNKLLIIWKAANISIRVKVKIYNSLVLSVLLYGCETWPLNKSYVNKLKGFEFKCLRKILKINFTQRIPNHEVLRRIRSATNYDLLIPTILKRQLRWYGHVMRRDSEDLTKLTLCGLVSGDRSIGRPRATWCAEMLRLANISRTNARNLCINRANWNNFINNTFNNFTYF